MVFSNSPKKQTNEFVITTTTNSFIRFLGEFEDAKKSFRNYLTFTSLSKKLNWNSTSLIDFEQGWPNKRHNLPDPSVESDVGEPEGPDPDEAEEGLVLVE